MIGIVRLCPRCGEYESIDNYDEGARICKPCMPSVNPRPVRGIARARGIVITQSGKELLAQWRAEETSAA